VALVFHTVYHFSMVDVELSEETVGLLKQLARPLEDTFDTLIGRLARAYLNHDSSPPYVIVEPTVAGNGRAVWDTSVDRHVREMSATAKDMFARVFQIVREIDPRTNVHGVQEYVGCGIDNRNFAAIFAQRNGLVVWFRPEATDGLPAGQQALLHGVLVDRPAKSPWRNDARMKVTPETDMNGVRELLHRSYQAVS
jgi:hypothetical protein